MTCLFADSPTTLRVTRLDECGAPVVGVDDGFVAECFSTLSMALVTDDLDDKIYRNAAGKVCAIKRGCRSLLGYDVTLSLQFISPEIMDILTGQPIVLDNLGEPVGWDNCDIKCNTGAALEVWVPVIGECDPTGAQVYLYFLLPWVTNIVLVDIELNSDALELELTGTTRAGGGWGTGPYDVVLNGAAPGTPGRLLTPLGDTCHRRIQSTPVAPPTPSCDYTEVPALIP